VYEPRLEAHFEDLPKQRHASRFGVWIFLASELLLFAGLFALYFAYRVHFPQIFHEGVGHNARALGTLNTCILLLGSAAAAVGVVELRRDRNTVARILFGLGALLALCFLAIKGVEYAAHFREGILPGGAGRFFAAHPEAGWPIFFTLYFAMTGLHAIHVAIGMVLLATVATWIGSAPRGARRALLAFRRRGLGLPLADVLPARGGGMSETRRLLLVAAALFVLVGASFLLSFAPLGPWAAPVALSFSAVKALLIAWYFMELREARTSLRAAALAAVLLFLLLVGLTTADVATREPAPLLPPATGR
jgi:cytochrome c oxidase subunit 3